MSTYDGHLTALAGAAQQFDGVLRTGTARLPCRRAPAGPSRTSVST
ncbi:hypothetical protein P9139_20785 [Curtobacterium flaccumfaciens]|nr:hypothetical protein P9139_20785 [Curtobacterium flaccumfaciens]